MVLAADDPARHPADRLLEIAGTVQGVGFRPFVARLAARRGVRGWVRNDARGVTVRAAGPSRRLDDFAAELQREAPPAARIAERSSASTSRSLSSRLVVGVTAN